MIKDKLTEAIEASLNNMKNGDDHVPLNMRGELEVIVKDRDGNVLSYEKGHNQVTNLAKMAIIHLLAGEVGVVDSEVYSVPKDVLRAYKLEKPEDEKFAIVYSSFDSSNKAHSSTINLDGTLVSGEQFFFDASEVGTKLSQIKNIDREENSLKFNFPTKMLFGTGIEAHDIDELNKVYSNASTTTICTLNGYSNVTSLPQEFFKYCAGDDASSLSNWYSSSEYKCRSLQPLSTTALDSSPTPKTTAISGAIKNCLITTTSDTNKYNGAYKMASPEYRGVGYPCFIYAKRSTSNFYNKSEGNEEVYYEMNDALVSTPYETELTYTVVMPAQPALSTDINSFYPYNGWILKQAGLFSDSRYKIRSAENDSSDTYKERTFIDGVGTESVNTTYRDSVGGQLLFTRNLSSPILKTPDNEVVFVWHIFITI